MKLRASTIILIGLLVIVGVVYLYTMAPTVSFWDCGEYIAVAYALGVPHPPGTPFFVIFGRVWVILFQVISAVLPISKEVGWHMNLTAVISSLISLGFVYVITLKLIRRWRSDDGSILPYIGAFGACLILAFGYTFWDNALETEMYAPATAILLFMTYLALQWHEGYERKVNRNRLILLIFYLVFLSSGIHLAPFLAVIPLYVYLFVVERKLVRDLYLWLIGGFVVLAFFASFIAADNLFKPSLVLLGLILGGALLAGMGRNESLRRSLFFWIGVLVVLIGFSSELFLVIRAGVLTRDYQAKVVSAPKINECNPSTAQTFYDVLHRKQYDPMKILPRKTQNGTGLNAVQGYFEQVKMYMRYFSWQFVNERAAAGPRLLLLLVFYGLGVWGIYQHYRKDKKTFILIFLLFMMTSFAMMSYLNLKFSPSDTHPAHQGMERQEVRERDYFFHPGFAYFAIFMGIGLTAFFDWVKRKFGKYGFAQHVAIGLSVVLSVIPFATHRYERNRYGNWIPRDFGYNMLACCDENSLVFTNGDNDTFPLWFVQTVLGYRSSVIIANLSLANTDWYIMQLKYWGAPISFPDKLISTCERWAYRTPYGKIMMVSDILIRHIISNNVEIPMADADWNLPPAEFARKFVHGKKGKMTIYFASTVGDETMEGMKPYLRLEGLVYRLVPESSAVMNEVAGIETDTLKTREFFTRTMRYNAFFDPEDYPFLRTVLPDFEGRAKAGEFAGQRVFKDENTTRLMTNYAANLFALGFEYKRAGDIERTKQAWKWAHRFRPQDFAFLHNIGMLYMQSGDYDSCLAYLLQIEARGVRDPRTLFSIANCYEAMGNNIRAEDYLHKTIALQPRFQEAYEMLVGIYAMTNRTDKAIEVLNEWLKIAPGDSSARRMIEDFSKRKPSGGP